MCVGLVGEVCLNNMRGGGTWGFRVSGPRGGSVRYARGWWVGCARKMCVRVVRGGRSVRCLICVKSVELMTNLNAPQLASQPMCKLSENIAILT